MGSDQAHCLDCGRFIRHDQVEPLPVCDTCIDRRLEAFAPELEPITERA